MMKKTGLIVCIAMLLMGCSTEKTRRQQAEDLYKSIYGNNENKAKQILANADVQDLPVLNHIPPQLLAAQVGDENIAMELLAKGMKANVKDDAGSTMLHGAAYNGSLKLANDLLKNKVNINAKTKDGWTPLLTAISPTSITPDKTEVVNWLLEHGADPTIATNKGWTALHEAVYQNQPKIVEKLLPLFKNPNIQDKYGATPLMLAVQMDYDNIVTLLIGQGSSLEIQDKKGYTALSYAVDYGLDAMTEALLQAGADPNHQTSQQETCFTLAEKSGNEKILSLLQRDYSKK